MKCVDDYFHNKLNLENFGENKTAKKLRKAIVNQLFEAVKGGFESVDSFTYDNTDKELVKRILNNVYTFAGFKNYQTIKALGAYLVDESSGNVRSFAEFKKIVLQEVHSKYNLQWLEAEYNTTYAQAQNASRWVEFEADKDLFPYLKYHTQKDANVRYAHKALEGFTAHIDNPIWDKIAPVKAWQCRCYLSNITEKDFKATPVKEINPPELPPNSPFAGGNVGKTGVVFGENHPYFAVKPPEKAAVNTVIEAERVEVFSNILDSFSGGSATKILLADEGFSKALERVKVYNLNGKMPQLTELETAAIHHYTGGGFSDLNSMLAGRMPTNKYLTEFDNLLEKSLSKLPTFEGTVYRRKSLSKERLAYYVANEGKKVKEPVYLSTSKYDDTLETIYSGDVWFIIQSKNGKYINPISFYGESFPEVDAEYEVLFIKNTLFEVSKIEKNGFKTLIYLEEQ